MNKKTLKGWNNMPNREIYDRFSSISCSPSHINKLYQELAASQAEVERLRDSFSLLTNEIECTPKCLSHQSDHCDCGRLERAYAISHSIAQNPTK
jgi:hypothetical protein